jgi:hypothetical protein
LTEGSAYTERELMMVKVRAVGEREEDDSLPVLPAASST